MAAAPHHAPPETTLAPRNQIHNQQQQNDGEQMEEVDMISTSPIRPKQQTGPISNSQPPEPKKSSQPVKENEVTRTDPQETKHNGHSVEENRDSRTEEDDDPRNPLDEFDWNDFEARYRQAMSEANNDEQAIRDDFERLVQYFGVWASSASQYDNDRSIKRIKTRKLFVQHAEQSLEQKRNHYTQVVEAFKNALALLGNS